MGGLLPRACCRRRHGRLPVPWWPWRIRLNVWSWKRKTSKPSSRTVFLPARLPDRGASGRTSRALTDHPAKCQPRKFALFTLVASAPEVVAIRAFLLPALSGPARLAWQRPRSPERWAGRIHAESRGIHSGSCGLRVLGGQLSGRPSPRLGRSGLPYFDQMTIGIADVAADLVLVLFRRVVGKLSAPGARTRHARRGCR